MLFETAIKELLPVIHKEGYTFYTEEAIRAYMEVYFGGIVVKDKFWQIVDKFVCEKSVEAPTSEILRLAIMGYTFGYFQRDIIYKNRFRNNPKDKGIYMAHSKLSFANALIQWKLMCEQLGFDWEEELALGQEHLEERYKDFRKDRWAKL